MEPVRSESGEAEKPYEMSTELVISVEGRFFINTEGVDPAKYSRRALFHGFALTEEEERNVRQDLDKLLRTARGCDGILYASVEGISPEEIVGRAMFHGFAMTDEENALAWEELYSMALNVTAGVQLTLRERRKGHAAT